jgi:hypothetical protein
MARPRKPIDEDLIVERYEAGLTLQEIADQLGVDRSCVTRTVKELGVYTERRGSHWLRKRQSAEQSRDEDI